MSGSLIGGDYRPNVERRFALMSSFTRFRMRTVVSPSGTGSSTF
ncbi:hypothetical protein [Rhodococcus sp. ZPP]|nr:hypothetical protein [Rhodococcus sp. ZPP]